MPDEADDAAIVTERAWEVFEHDRRQREMADAAATRQVPGLMHCLDCGEPVPAARQRAVPRTRRCAPCASEVEG